MRIQNIAVILLVAFTANPGYADDKSPKSPLPPREAVKQFVVHPNLKVELVACEPQVVDPVAIRFDEDGRLWVVEMRDYPNGPSRGAQPAGFKKNDKARGPRPAGSCRIRVLRDKNRDGFYETATTFADNLLFATGLQPWKGGVIVTLAGEVAYFKDTNGDDKADVRETWFKGFAQKNPQLRANHPTFALDNHIYIANGLRGGMVVATPPGPPLVRGGKKRATSGVRKLWPKKVKPVSISGMDFRFDPRTGKYEAVSGHGQFGLTFDDYGNRFICSNRNPCRHVVLENRYLKRNPHLAVPSVMHDVSPAGADSKVYPISRTWTTSTLHAGQFTAACGVTIYRGDALPKEFRGNSFTCEPTGNLVHRDVLKPQGATFTSKPGRKGIEFLATKDEWFRPVNLANGPDGALYVVDMYRAVIEHPQWVPDELKNRPDARLGDDRGRIYRIVSKKKFSRDLKPAQGSAAWIAANLPKLSKASTAELVTLLEHPNAWHRMTASRLLYERQDKQAAKPLIKLVRNKKLPQASCVQGMWTLRGLSCLAKNVVADVLEDKSRRRMQEHALRLIEPWIDARVKAPDYLLLAGIAPDARLRFQSLLSIGEISNGEGRSAALAFLADHGNLDIWSQQAILSSANGREASLLQGLIIFARQSESPKNSPEYNLLIRSSAGLAGRRSKKSEILRALKYLNTFSKVKLLEKKLVLHLQLRLSVVIGLAEGLKRRGLYFREYMAALPDDDKQKINKLLAEAIHIVKSTKVDRAQRVNMLPILECIDPKQAAPVLHQLTLKEKDRHIRLAAIDMLDAFPVGDTDKQLLAGFKRETPDVKRAILDLFLSDKKRTTLLLDAIAAKRIPINELDPARVRRLTRYRDKTIRDRAKKLLAAAIPAERKKVLAEYQKALTLKADAQRGRAIFKKNCATCHRIGDIGVNVAPDIGDSRTKTPAQLLTSILDPNRAIDNNYISYTVVLKTGKVQTGIIATETSSSITLRQPENKQLTLLRRDIDVLKSNGVSLMPVGLEKNITVQQMADLVSFIKNWRYLDGRVPLSPNKNKRP